MSAVAQPLRQAHDGRVAVTHAAPAPLTLAGWALLTMDGVTLALPQKDIVTIELVSALQPVQDGGNEIGWFAQDAQRWPVYCLDRGFALAPTLAPAVRVCVLFRCNSYTPPLPALSPSVRGNVNELRTLGLAGTQVSLLAADADLSVPPLPTCLARPGSPLAGLALHRDAIVAVVHAQPLGLYLSTLLEAAQGG